MLTPALAQSLRMLGITPEMLHTLLHTRSLQPCAEAIELTLADTGPDGREYLLEPQAAAAWRAMKAAAAHDGVHMGLVSAFRSVARQTEILRDKLAAGVSIEEALRWVAPPGFSEHHTGRAIDIGVPGEPALEEDFETTPAYAWLQRHAGAHGFRLSYPRGNSSGYGYEPWHWCFHGASALA
jgi:D-alanyl-D-alanine carboxypeptidase